MPIDIHKLPFSGELTFPGHAGFVAVKLRGPVAAYHVAGVESAKEIPLHEHECGQLILALGGAISCHVPGSVWMVPPGRAVWIPAGMPHRSTATPNSRMCFLFVSPSAARLPERGCTLEITPMVREMVLHLADNPNAVGHDDHHSRLQQVLLGELERMQAGGFQLPVSQHPKLKRLQDALAIDPSDRTALGEWARRLATSERTLARLIVKESGMTFGRWRQQLHLLVAVTLLSEGSSVQQVSDALGYETATSFIIMFKKALGTTPAKYFEKEQAVRTS